MKYLLIILVLVGCATGKTRQHYGEVGAHNRTIDITGTAITFDSGVLIARIPLDTIDTSKRIDTSYGMFICDFENFRCYRIKSRKPITCGQKDSIYSKIYKK